MPDVKELQNRPPHKDLDCDQVVLANEKDGPPTQNWKTFLENHLSEIVPVDFLTVPIVIFENSATCCVFFRMDFSGGTPITGTNWEGTGIAPHLACTKAEAKDTAYLHALENLENNSDNRMQKTALAWTREGLVTTLSPVSLSTKELKKYIGQYGPRHIKLDGETMVYQKKGRDPYVMTPMGDDRFMIVGLDYFRIQFERDDNGKVIRLVGMYNNGRRDGNDRDK